jgi:anti-sigma factor RsiW
MSVTCTALDELWIALDEGVLPAGARAELEAHLNACPSCARQTRKLAALDQRLEDLGDLPVEPPPFLKARVLARLGEGAVPRRWSWRSVFSSRRLLAVSMACLAFFAGLLVREVRQLNRWARQGGLQPVVLEFQAPGEQDVQLVGDFNNWGRDAGPVQAERRDGRWIFRMALSPGSYQYAYLIDGKRWLPDPGSPGIIPDGFGGENSLLYVSDSRGPEARSL